MEMRPKQSAKDLPPRMLRRTKKLVSGKLWAGYYYNGRDANGRRKEIPLGTDLAEAKKKWAVLEGKPARGDNLMEAIFDRYEREIIPAKAPGTQKTNLYYMAHLRKSFSNAPIDSITPQQIAIYRDARTKKISANKEISLLSHIFNIAREWGYTAKENPVRGVRKNKEVPRDYYVEKDAWGAVYSEATGELRDAMDLAYLTGQRPGDVLKMSFTDIQSDVLEVLQNKTGKKLRILLNGEHGERTELGRIIDRLKSRHQKVRSLYLVSTPAGRNLSKYGLRKRFDRARIAAACKAESIGNIELSNRIKRFQFRDIRSMAATDIPDLEKASKLLGHTKQDITKRVYRLKGETVTPTR